MKHLSIRAQFSMIFIALTAVIILLCWLMNSLFLADYYLREKKDVLLEAADTIREAAEQDSYGTDEFSEELEEISRVYNIAVCVTDMDSQLQYVSSNGGREVEARLFGYIFGVDTPESEIVEAGDDYVIQTTGQLDGGYLEMLGTLSTGVSFIMQTPLESIRESSLLANRFLGYVGICGIVIGAVVIWIIAGRITRPIKELSNISMRMVNLDFDAKYHRTGKFHLVRNEIDALGDNINLLSASLEESISELKTANNQLQNDLAHHVEIDEMRKEFLANVSHELKTPIALIQGYAEGLQEGMGDDEESRNYYCEVIVDEASKMNTMVKQLLTLNQLEFGNDAVNMERFDVVGLIRNYIQSASILTTPNDITVRMADYEPIYVWADEFKTEEVFTNYFTNAVHHCEGDEKLIEVTLTAETDRVRVQVFNTGKPIPEESVPHLWEKFYKVDKARTRAYGGSGVGLSIVKAIQESMNQEYGVTNYDNGVAFWFTLDT